MRKGNLYRIYPNEEQKQLLEQHFGACRFIYNKFLGIRSTFYDKFRTSISRTELDAHLIVFKDICPWLKNVNSQSLQQANKNLDTAFKNFFEGKAGYPQRKTKKENSFSFQVTQRYKINLTTSEVFIPNVGWMEIVLHRALFNPDFFAANIRTTGVDDQIIIEKNLNSDYLRTATVSRTSAGRYHISILTEDGNEYPEPQQFLEENMIGADVGIKTFVALSTGEVIENPKFLKKSIKKLKSLQRKVSRKVLGSNNRRKVKKKLAKQHQLVSNQRNNFQHKVSLKLVRDNQAVAVETLNIKGMQKKPQTCSGNSRFSMVRFRSQINV